jgi:hypothetical protein
MNTIFRRAVTRRLFTAALLGSALVTVAPASTAGATSSGCADVNAGAWNRTITGPGAVSYSPLLFDAGETISITMTATSNFTGGYATTYLRNGFSSARFVSTGSLANGTTTTLTASYTVTGSVTLYVSLEASSDFDGEGAVTNSSTFTCTSAPVACLPGSYSGTGLEPCTPASPGHYVPTSGAVAQFACSQGYFQASPGATGCDAAPPGHYVGTTAATSASECLPGTYQPLAGTTMCAVAEPGTYVPTASAIATTPCLAGYYQPNAGATTCLAADPGSFVPTDGSAAQSPCLAGFYQPNAASTSCLAAQPGFFVSAAGAMAQSPCPSGTTSQAAAVECTSIYVFTGFAAPVDPSPTLNAAKAGQTIPLKFTVTDHTGAPVSTLTSVSVTVTSLACSVGTTIDAIEEYASGESGLRYLGDGRYQFNWKAPKSYASSCKTLTLGIGDGVPHTALFEFKK